MKKLIAMFLVALSGGLIALAAFTYFTKNDKRVDAESPRYHAPVQLTGGVPAAPPDFVNAAEISIHAVVHIKAEFARKNNLYDDFFENFFYQHGARGPQPIIGTGSGVIISGDGYIVTNNHVVQDASKIEVTLNDKRSFTAKVVGSDASTDLALIRIEAADLPYLTYGNSDLVKVGEWVMAVGNPFNLTSTVTAGIVSAKARNISILKNPNGTTIESFIQTDAAVNRGNSGGALVNTQGELIGINAAIASGNGFYTGYSFAIPVNIVKKVVRDFMQYGDIQRAYLGVQIQEVDANLAKEKSLKDIRGVYVAGLMENSSAEKAGIKKGDVITRVHGSDVNTNAELVEVISQYSPGDKLKVEVNRSGDLKTFDVTLTNESGTTKKVKREEADFQDNLGASFRPVPDEVKNELRISGGVEVAELTQGPLASIGIKKGFIITRIDRIKINSVQDLKDAIRGKRGGILIEGLYPNGMRAYYGLGL